MLVMTSRGGTLSNAVVLLIAASMHRRQASNIHSSRGSGALTGGRISVTLLFGTWLPWCIIAGDVCSERLPAARGDSEGRLIGVPGDERDSA